MSFIRYIYNSTFFKRIFNRSFSLGDILKDAPAVLAFLNDIKNGKTVDGYETKEFQISQDLSMKIDLKEELVPLIVSLINDRTRGAEIRQILIEHRVLVNTLYYNEDYVIAQVRKIIHELYETVRREDAIRGTMKTITPQVKLMKRER